MDMKTLKYISMMLLLVAVSAGFTSCSDDDDDDDKGGSDSIVGIWRHNEPDGSITELEFKSNNTFVESYLDSWDDDWYEESGDWEISGKTLYLEYIHAEKPGTYGYYYSVKGDRLNLTPVTIPDSVEVYHRVD